MKTGNHLRHGRIVVRTAVFRVWNWLKEHRDVVRYVIVGGLTTLIDFVISFLLYRFVNEHIANVAAWIAAVLFAFAANKLWVFESKTRTPGRVVAELAAFAGGRLLTLGMQELIFLVATDWLRIPARYVKIPASILVIIANYFLTRFVFRRRKTEERKPPADDPEETLPAGSAEKSTPDFSGSEEAELSPAASSGGTEETSIPRENHPISSNEREKDK